jgi:hypothetical protein
MLQRRLQLSGLFAMLLALMAQLGSVASVPRVAPPPSEIVLCHTDDDKAPAQAPVHPTDCQMCPLCVGPHVQTLLLASGSGVSAPATALAIERPELPPPATAPPSPNHPPNQPRAPPILS